MVAGGVDEDVVLIPGAALDPDVLVDRAQTLELLVADVDVWKDSEDENTWLECSLKDRSTSLTVLGDESQVGHVGRPDDVLHLRHLDARHHPARDGRQN